MGDQLEPVEGKISSSDAALYDRQIRLWGVDAQRRIQSSNVLLLGFRGLHVELAKNLVLAGMSITIQDDENASGEDLGTNFFLSPDSVGKNRAEVCVSKVQELNPTVVVQCISKAASSITSEELAKYTVVSAELRDPSQALRLDSMCSNLGIPFYLQDMMGVDAFMFCNLGKHTCLITQKKKSSEDGEETVTSTSEDLTYCSLKDALQAKWGPLLARKRTRVPDMFFAVVLKFSQAEKGEQGSPDGTLDDLMTQHGVTSEKLNPAVVLELYERLNVQAEFAAACAIVAGIVGQEVIKAVSRKDRPIKNFFFYSGWQGGGVMKDISS